MYTHIQINAWCRPTLTATDPHAGTPTHNATRTHTHTPTYTHLLPDLEAYGDIHRFPNGPVLQQLPVYLSISTPSFVHSVYMGGYIKRGMEA